ncbi:cytochrome P450 [Fusarium acuminatum]|uniref:Cytochrome P450 n=1 Tax=Fusarium acuminatum TaxID=5515 RepID=A0ABZ2X5I2_9HYPO
MGNTQSLPDAAANRWPVVLTALLVCFIAAITPKVGSVLRLWTIPIVGEELGSTEKRRKAYLAGARKLYSDGYQKFKNGVFMITTSKSSPTIVISPDFLPELKKLPDSTLSMEAAVDERIAEAEAFLEPVVKSRTDAMADPSYEKPDDFLQWLIDGKDKFPDKNSQNLAKVQLGLTFAAVHTTTLTATNAFYDLAAMPNIQAELRDEVREALSQSGGVFTSNVLQTMKKMDSFLKETLRVHPATMASFQRKVLKTFTLSNGQVIPAGLMIEIPAVAVNSDSYIFPNAEEFDPLRFYRLRSQAKDEGSVEKAANNQFVSVNQSSLTFGYGRHACPGRFFAANEIKMILAHALLRYDVKLVGSETKRYANMEFAHMSIPDPSRNLLFKAIEV